VACHAFHQRIVDGVDTYIGIRREQPEHGAFLEYHLRFPVLRRHGRRMERWGEDGGQQRAGRGRE